LGAKPKRPHILVCYDLLEGLTNEDEDLVFDIEPKLFSIGTITISSEIISLLNVGVSEIKSIEESNLGQRTSDKKTTKMAPSIIKLEDFYVRP
jgi:hypothetical protein